MSEDRAARIAALEDQIAGIILGGGNHSARAIERACWKAEQIVALLLDLDRDMP